MIRKSTKPKALWVQVREGLARECGAVLEVRQKIKRTTYIRAVSAAMASVRREEAKLKKAFLARPENRWCPVSSAIQGVKRRTTDHHHTRGKAFPALRLAVEWWLAVSRWGHNWIENNREEARRRGWLCQRGVCNTLQK